MNVEIVGAGLMGSCCAKELSRRGHRVTVREQHPLGHDLGSSHGRSRIVRKAYPDPFYTELMLTGYPLWLHLQSEAGETLVHECGLFYYGSDHSPELAALQEGVTRLGVDHERIADHPWLRPGEHGILSRDGGWVAADRALVAIQRIAREQGAIFVSETVTELPSADAVIVCAGPWIRRFFDLPVRTSIQTFAYFEGTMDGPVWIEDGVDNIYGFPSEPGQNTFKVGYHRAIGTYDPADPRPDPDRAQVEIIRGTLARFGLADAPLVSAHTCLYTSTANEDFIVDWVDDATFAVSPCSGHGFKFGPWIGLHVANCIEGIDAPLPRFCAPQK